MKLFLFCFFCNFATVWNLVHYDMTSCHNDGPSLQSNL